VYEATSGQGTVLHAHHQRASVQPRRLRAYNISIVELVDQEGLRFTTNVVGCPPEEVHIGMHVRVQFEQHGEVFVPAFIPDSSAGENEKAHTSQLSSSRSMP
jgi:hypothetical protein